MEQTNMDQESNKKRVFECAMKGKWEDVIEMYKKDATLHRARITRAGDTALHIAVSEGKEVEVKQMVDIISQKEAKEALKTQNNRKNTALHLAASMGNATMCHIIASADPSLVDDRNVDGETPLFLAALYGRKKAFLCLHYIQNRNNNNHSYVNCRRNNGDTFLHCAINGDYFDLAFQIIHLYKELANWKNEEGMSPLHLLASKPCAFRSGSRLGRTETIIYHCLYVEELEVEDPPHEQETCPISIKDCDPHDCPDNCNTCWDVFKLMKTAVTVAMGDLIKVSKGNFLRIKGEKAKGDAEDPEVANTNNSLGGSGVRRAQVNRLFPANYRTCSDLIKFFYLVLLIILGQGFDELKKIYRKKENHTWTVQIVKELLCRASSYEREDDGSNPHNDKEVPPDKQRSMNNIEGAQHSKRWTMETPILVAAKNGVMEIIENIQELFPVAIHDLTEDKKNIVLLAVQHRQPHVYEFLLSKNIYKENLFRQVDNEGNSALHLAATLGDYKPWLTPGEAFQMQWELKWYKFVNEPFPHDFFVRYNKKNETPDVIFTKTHKDLVKSAAEWLKKTSESCSLVAALIATVAFATAATVPGGVNQDSGHPTLENEPAFEVFAVSSLIALACSIMALVMFLSILTSRFQEQNFIKDLPRKLLVGLTSLFISIAAMLVSFCAGHFFVLKHQLQYAALPIYLVTCLPVTLFVLAQFPLYFDLLWATFKHVPQRSYKPT